MVLRQHHHELECLTFRNQFCSKLMNLVIYEIEHMFAAESKTKKPFLKLSDANIKEPQHGVTKVYYFLWLISHLVLKISSIQSSCAHTMYIIQTIQPMWLFFPGASLSSSKESEFLLVFMAFFFWKMFFCVFNFAGYFGINFWFFYLGLILFLLILIIFSWSCSNSLLKGELLMSSDSPPRWFVRLTDLETFEFYLK